MAKHPGELRICTVEGCEQPVKACGRCAMHDSRMRRHGTVGGAQSERTPQAGSVCVATGCDRAAVIRGCCPKHYKRLRTTGDPEGIRRKKGGPCKIDGCERPVAGRGWCKYHWARWSRTGDPVGSLRRIDPAPEGMKTCRTCGTAKPLDDFYQNSQGRLGRQAHCKSCANAYHLGRYWADPDRAREKAREWGALNRHLVNERHRAQYAADRKVAIQRSRDWQRANPEKVRAADRRRYRNSSERRTWQRAQAARWRRENAERALALTRAWRAANPDRVSEARYRYQARKLRRWVEDVERAVVFARDDGICQLCHQPVDPSRFHLDHIVPVSRGGEHSYANIQLAHPRCNQSKNAQMPDELAA